MKNLILKLMIAMQMISINAFAGDSSHGENPKEAQFDRKLSDLNDVISQLPLAMMNMMIELRKPVNTIQPLQEIMQKGLVNDVLVSKYNFEETKPCYEDVVDKKGKVTRREVPASAVMNDLGGDICFSKRLLIETGTTTLPALIRTAFHEHAHHFGKDDAVAIQIGTHVWKYAEKNMNRILNENSFSLLRLTLGTIVPLPYGKNEPVYVRFTLTNPNYGFAVVTVPGLVDDEQVGVLRQTGSREKPLNQFEVELNLEDPSYSYFGIYAGQSETQKVQIVQGDKVIFSKEGTQKTRGIDQIITLTWK